MRQRFEQQTTLGITPVSEVKFPLRSRDELPPVLKALQHIFVTPQLNQKVFSILETKICFGKKKTGRKGMDLWHILVLAVVRHALDTNWDRLEDLSNNHRLIRQIMGIHVEQFGIKETEFSYQTIVDNVSLLDETMLQQINHIVVEHGHNLLKKKEEELLRLKTDSYALETNVHFPTDLNLLWDSLRKALEITERINTTNQLKGWRKIKSIKRNAKRLFRNASQQVFRGGPKNPDQKRQAVKDYLQYANQINKRVAEVMLAPLSIDFIESLMQLRHYQQYIIKFIDQIERRLIMGQEIPATEKIYSIFEPHTEWISKGKMHPNVELGKLLLITTDQFHFIVDYKVMEHEKDATQITSLCERINRNFAGKKIASHSFDKGFFSNQNYHTLKESVQLVVLPKRGKKNKEEQERESNKTFKKLRDKHSAIESNINMLEHHGLNRCPDKGLRGLKAYVGLSVLAYNLHIMGNQLIALEKNRQDETQSINLIRKAA